ncbi:Ribosomal RNA small subunit methyltransferase H [Syntrophomonas zehnderi OL-4]|uniref:Ribosomal RNA small subunit methyltransferase H n=1 Tax=Syntrophomonas zehnderi OL-4 TaxID=690567 RepID=A0A0E4GDU1_9FIRM|nr:Ribosomal RNA small subunit methyltransferase H [Syntrophomonas zehnderi OL-4]
MHQAVLLPQTVDYWLTDPCGTYVDCTLGGGGHLRCLAEKLSDNAQVIALDKDQDILQKTALTLNIPRLTMIHGDFRNLQEIMDNLGIKLVDGILIDLGVSSFQLDIAERGFSFHEDAALDMRMNRQQSLSAWDIVNSYSEADLTRILYQYGEEKYARSISRAIVNYREHSPIDSTLELVSLIQSSVPASYRREKHPARKTFQALRIEVNGELDALIEVLPQTVDLLKPGGRICVISFHSLEDRIVKQFMQDRAKDCICPPGLPVCTCNHRAELKILTRKPVTASTEECEHNPRARSAKLRAASKI